MSSVYTLEPPTRGKVVMKTTFGDLDIELWPKEAPKAVRNFVQLCVDGYYDNTVFHRIIKGFMAQGGDPTGTGTGGESIYRAPFIDEIHSRLKFNHRGQVACANAGTPNTNASQFFITLDRCDWLDKKNTIFGKVTGNTVYNLAKLGDVEVGKDDAPLDPPEILSIEVIWNPFDDIVPRSEVQRRAKAEEEEAEAAQPKKKGKKQLNLLSFGEEAEEEEAKLVTVKGKIKSSHDVLDDPRLLRDASNALDNEDPEEAKRRDEIKASVKQTLAGRRQDRESVGGRVQGEGRGGNSRFRSAFDSPTTSGGEGDSGDGGEYDFDLRMKRKILEKRKQMGDARIATNRAAPGEEKKAPEMQQRDKDDRHNNDASEDEGEDDNGGRERKDRLKLSKKKGLGSDARALAKEAADIDSALLSPLERQRQLYKQKKRSLGGRQESTLVRLAAFKGKLKEVKRASIPNSKSDGASNDEPEDKEGFPDWMVHKLKFDVNASQKDSMDRNQDPDQYAVYDPLLEKGKEKFNKMQAKSKKRNREWAGRSIT